MHKLGRDVQVKDRRYTHWSKEAHENSLANFFNLRDLLVDGKHPGKSSKEQDQNAEGYQAVQRDHVVCEELVPGAHGAIPHEDGHVEEHVDRGLEGVVEGLKAEPVVPCECVAGNEAGKNTKQRC